MPINVTHKAPPPTPTTPIESVELTDTYYPTDFKVRLKLQAANVEVRAILDGNVKMTYYVSFDDVRDLAAALKAMVA